MKEMYNTGSFPIVSRSLVSLYVEVAGSGGNASKVDLSRVGATDSRVDQNQLWTAQKRRKSGPI